MNSPTPPTPFLSIVLLSIVAAAALAAAGCAPRAVDRFAVPPDMADLRGDAFVALDMALRDATRSGGVPGASLSVGRDGHIIYESAAGFRDLAAEGGPLPATRATLFDAASLAKPIAAAGAVLLALEGRLGMGERAWDGGPTPLELMLHTGELPEYADWRELDAHAPLLPQLAALPLPDDFEGYRYSNIGLLALGLVVEERAGEPFEGYLAARLFAPLGMDSTTWRPASGAPVARTASDVAPGAPFDPLAAWVLARHAPSVPGHSGLFATAGDLNRFAQALLFPDQAAASIPRWREASLLLLHDVREVRTVRRVGGATATFARERRTPAFPIGADCPRVQTGHTGCVMWIDPSRGLSYVLLTNSVHGADDGAWRALDAEVRRILLASDLRPPRSCAP